MTTAELELAARTPPPPLPPCTAARAHAPATVELAGRVYCVPCALRLTNHEEGTK